MAQFTDLDMEKNPQHSFTSSINDQGNVPRIKELLNKY